MTQSFEEFEDYDGAFERMVEINKAYQIAGNKKDIACVVPGPAGDDYAVVDMKTAIELDAKYVWAVSGWIENPRINN